MVIVALMAASVIIVIGFLASYFFQRTGLPDMLFLIGLGIIFGPILHVFDPNALASLAPYIGALALVFILFDGGMSMNLYHIFSETPRAEILAIVSFIISVITITLFTHFLMGLPFLYGVLLGSICGGSSSVVVVSLAMKVKVSERCATTMALESAITDILCIVVSLAVLRIIITGQADYVAISKTIASQFSTGALIGVLFGVLWLGIIRKVAEAPYAYMLTLAAVLAAYSTSEYLGGSGALSSLVFGVVLGNESDILRMIRRETTRHTFIDEGLKRFESEIAFLIRAFFFVYLGLIITITRIDLLIWGVVLSLMLLGVRYVAVKLATIRSPFTHEEQKVLSVMLARGLAAAVLSTLPLQYGLPYADLFINLTLVVIIMTTIICTVGVPILSSRGY